MRRFAFFERDVSRVPALSCLDVTCAAAGRGVLALGDSEGRVVLLTRDLSVTAFQAHALRVTALAQVKGSDVLITIGDGADSRPPTARAAARAAVLTARDREARTLREQLRQRAAAAAREAEESGAGGEDDASAEALDDQTDLATLLGIGGGIALENAASSLFRGDEAWKAGASLGEGGGSSSSSSSSSSSANTLPPGISVLKVWRLDKRDGSTGAPECIRTMRLFPPSSGGSSSGGRGGTGAGGNNANERTVTCLAVSDDASQVAVGCGDGTLLILRGDFLRASGGSGRSEGRFPAFGLATSLTSGASVKHQLLYDPAAEGGAGVVPPAWDGVTASFAAGVTPDAVTCLAYALRPDPAAAAAAASASPSRTASGGASNASSRRAAAAAATAAAAALRSSMLCLFVCTPSRVQCYFPTHVRPLGMSRGWGPGEASIDLDGGDGGCGPGCATLTDTGEWAVASDAGVFFYTHEDRKAAYVFPGRKQRLAWFRSYLVLAAEEGGSGVGGAAARGVGGGGGNNALLALGGSSRAVFGGGVGGLFGGSGGGGGATATIPVAISVYDLRHKFIAYSMTTQVAPAAPAVAVPSVVSATGGIRGGGNGGAGPDPTSAAATLAACTAAAFASPGGVRFVLSEWGTIFILAGDASSSGGPSSAMSGGSGGGGGVGGSGISTVFSLTEKDWGSKVDSLCSLHLFDLAAAIADGAGAMGRVSRGGGVGGGGGGGGGGSLADGGVGSSSDLCGDIHKQHGDYLYSRGDHEGAVLQYIKTLRSVEPSYVIRRFLEPQRSAQLTSYLEALHASGAASGDHTTLLLNCYTKSRATDKLRRFIRGGDGGEGSAGTAAGASSQANAVVSAVNFDVRTAISVLRGAGCWGEALWLADRHAEHNLYIGLQLQLDDDRGSSSTGSGGVLSELSPSSGSPPPPPPSASSSSSSSTVATTTASASAASAAAASATPGGAPGTGALAAITYITRLPFLEAEYYCRKYGRSLICGAPDAATTMLIALCTRWGSASGGGGKASARASAATSGPRPRVRTDSPDPFLPLFVDAPHHLKRFAEAIVRTAAITGSGVAPPSPQLWHTLLEVSLRPDVYAAMPSSGGGDAPLTLPPDWERQRDEAVMGEILKNPVANWDAPTALVLCNAACYRPGVVYLYERLRLYSLALSALMDAAEAARSEGRHAEAKAARRDLVRRAKQFTEPGAAEAGSGGLEGAVASASSGGGSSGDVEAGNVWVSILRYLAASYLDETGATAMLADASVAEGEESSQRRQEEDADEACANAAPPAVVRVSYPGLSPASPALLQREREEQDALLSDVLKHIDRAGLLPPLTVLNALATCPHLPFGLVKDFLSRRLEREAVRTEEDNRVTASLQADVAAAEAEIARLDGSARTFQARRCRLCALELELPSVHFMCGGLLSGGGTTGGGGGGPSSTASGGMGGSSSGGEEHSFHFHCVTEAMGNSNSGMGGGGGGDGAGGVQLECPICAPTHRQVRDIRASLGPHAGLQEQYFRELRASPDGFAKSVEFLSRGLYV